VGRVGQSSRVTGKAEPRFDIDYAYGRQGELLIGEFLEWIARGNGEVEVKRKRYLDFECYIETHCDYGGRGVYVPSGISITTAKAWAIVIGDTEISIIVPTEQLRSMLDDPSAKDRAGMHGSCPTRGKLINLAVLLYRHKQKLARCGLAPRVR